MSIESIIESCHQKMCPELEKIELNEVQKQIICNLAKTCPIEKFKTKNVDTMVKNTIGVTCNRCNSDNVFVKSVQLRSADEATSKIYTCLNCNNTWRVG